MVFKNITKNEVLNANGRLVDPGGIVNITPEYYDKAKGFLGKYVSLKKAEITGLDEYDAFVKQRDGKEEPVKKVEEPVKKAEEPVKKAEEPKKDEVIVEAEEPKKETPKKTTRRKAKTKTEEE